MRLIEEKKEELIETNPKEQINQRFIKRQNIIECLPFTAYMSEKNKCKLLGKGKPSLKRKFEDQCTKFGQDIDSSDTDEFKIDENHDNGEFTQIV